MSASGQGMPMLKKFNFVDNSFVTCMTRNGKWALTDGFEDYDATAKIVDVNTGKSTDISSALKKEITSALSEDASVVVGNWNGMPGYWTKNAGKWQALEIKSSQDDAPKLNWNGGMARSVTADGKYAVGYLEYNEWQIAPALWDLTTGKTVSLPGLPTLDSNHEDHQQSRFSAISADGRYIIGCIAPSYGRYNYIYDRETSTYQVIGFIPSDTEAWTPMANNLYQVFNAFPSNDFKYITGAASVFNEASGEYYYVPYRYEIATDKFELFDEDAVKGACGYVVTDDGIVLASTPFESAYRNWMVRKGNYWLSIESIMKQKWGIDFLQNYGYDNTGTIENISNDGRRLLAAVDFNTDGSSYTIDFPQPINELLSELKVLGTYTVTPSENAEISAVNNITISFDRNIEVTKTGTGIVKLEDEDGKVLASSINNSAKDKDLIVAFRPGKANLEEGKHYFVHVPANVLSVSGDAEETNDDIYVEYVGRRQGAVQLTKVIPADGNKLAKIDEVQNPIMLYFDTKVKMNAKETRKAYVYENDETEPYAVLNFAYGDKMVALTPATTVFLYKGNKYRVEIPAGVITDEGGNGGNEAMNFNFEGSYEREISADDETLFQNNFDKRDLTTAFLLYDGDQRTPGSVAAGWGFKSTYPWWIAKSSNATTDYAAVSHSMYSPAGKSDDWMVVPQLYIPDANCKLKFQSQGYLSGKDDVLKVYVWASDKGYNALSKEVVDKIRTEGKLVYEKIQEPGANQETLEGEWMNNEIDLAEFAGKSVYIAFVNENEDQSAIFLDNVEVKHNMHILVSMDNETSVVAQNEMKISGIVQGNNENKTYTDLKLKLKDANGTIVDTKNYSGLQLKKGEKMAFAFERPLPLTVGVEVPYSVTVECDGESFEVTKSIKDLAFSPVKRAVVEEFTGRDCPNCPEGLIALDNLENRFGDKVYPIGIHCYSGDPLGDGLGGYASFLGYSVAPSANVCRQGVSFPMVYLGDNYYMSSKLYAMETGGTTDKLWADLVEDELNEPAESEITATASYDAADETLDVSCGIKYALNTYGKNINLFTALVEDDVDNLYQKNGVSSYTNPIFGDWGKDGKYGSEFVTNYLCQDVCRAVLGTTYNGTAGLLPQDLVAGVQYPVELSMPLPTTVKDINKCKVIVMMLDADNGKFINAIRVDLRQSTDIHAIKAGTSLEKVKVYNLQGMKVAEGPVSEVYRGLHGIYIANGKKMILK